MLRQGRIFVAVSVLMLVLSPSVAGAASGLRYMSASTVGSETRGPDTRRPLRIRPARRAGQRGRVGVSKLVGLVALAGVVGASNWVPTARDGSRCYALGIVEHAQPTASESPGLLTLPWSGGRQRTLIRGPVVASSPYYPKYVLMEPTETHRLAPVVGYLVEHGTVLSRAVNNLVGWERPAEGGLPALWVGEPAGRCTGLDMTLWQRISAAFGRAKDRL